MDTMTLTKEQMELKAMVPTVQSGNARVRELTPAQRRAVMFAQQQVLRARAAKKARDERQAASDPHVAEERSCCFRTIHVGSHGNHRRTQRGIASRGPSAMYCARSAHP